MAVTVRIVDVQDRKLEIARAEVVDGEIRYLGAIDVIRPIIERQAEQLGISDAEALGVVAERGWSNGYLMVAPQ